MMKRIFEHLITGDGVRLLLHIRVIRILLLMILYEGLWKRGRYVDDAGSDIAYAAAQQDGESEAQDDKRRQYCRHGMQPEAFEYVDSEGRSTWRRAKR